MNLRQKRAAVRKFEDLLNRLDVAPDKQFPTVNEIFHKCLRSHWGTPRYRESGYYQDVYGRYYRLIEPYFGKRAVNDISREEIRQWHFGLLPSPADANAAKSHLSVIFEHALQQELIEYNPCDRIQSHVERKRHRYASKEEQSKILKQLLIHINDDRLGQKDVRNKSLYILAVAVTGSRPEAFRKAVWGEVTTRDDGSAVFVFQGKNSANSGEPESVVFPKFLMDLIGPRQSDVTRVFSDSRYSHFWRGLMKRLGIKDLWARDLRRTFATNGLSKGIPIETIGEILNHKDYNTTKRYAKVFPENKIQASLQISEEIRKLF